MCLQYLKLKTKHQQGLRYAYVPCGKCADCRKNMQDAWKFRLFSEFLDLKKKGWNVAFCTLTYDETSLPKIPEECFKNPQKYRDIACFDRTTVREWIDSIRQYCKYHYKFTNGNNIRYFIASEYGSNTHRPHYHAMLAWPSSVSYNTMHALATHYWNKGFLFPRKPEGDEKCKCFEVIGDASHALAYCSKYACKDIDFEDEIKDVELYDNIRKYEEGTNERAYARIFKNCKPFHIQSCSLGLEPIKNMSDDEKREVFVNGMAFVGDGNTYQVPIYIKNKILFNNYYIVDEKGNRMVRREASAFFDKYGAEIFNEKAKFYQKYVCETNENWLRQNGVTEGVIEYFSEGLNKYKNIVKYYYGDSLLCDNLMGKMYMAYNNIKPSECYDQPLYIQWMMRYKRKEENDRLIYNNELKPNYSSALYNLKKYWQIIDALNTYVGITKIADREKEEKLTKKILDYFKKVIS